MKEFVAKQLVIMRPAKISQFFGVLMLGLMLAGSPVSLLHAETPGGNNSVIASVTVNINTASANDLAEALIGVGGKKAQAIVEYRDANGPFTDKKQLLNVKGIGEATLDKNRSVITL